MKKNLMLTAAALAVTAALAFPAFAVNATSTVNGAVNGAAGAVTTATGGTATQGTDANNGATQNANAADANAAGKPTYGSPTSNDSSAKHAMALGDIDMNRPFGDLAIDQTLAPDALDKSLNAKQRAELRNRCNVIMSNSDKFMTGSPKSVAEYCMGFNEYWKKAYPNEAM